MDPHPMVKEIHHISYRTEYNDKIKKALAFAIKGKEPQYRLFPFLYNQLRKY